MAEKVRSNRETKHNRNNVHIVDIKIQVMFPSMSLYSLFVIVYCLNASFEATDNSKFNPGIGDKTLRGQVMFNLKQQSGYRVRTWTLIYGRILGRKAR